MAMRPFTRVVTLQAQYTVPANAPAGSILNVVFIDPQTGSQIPVIQLPTTQEWYILDIYVNASPGVDAQIVVRKNDVDRYTTAPLSALNYSVAGPKPSLRAMNTSIKLEPSSRLAMLARTLAAGGAAAVTVTFNIDVLIVDRSLLTT